MEIANIKQGKVDRIVNTQKKGNEAEVYHRVWVEEEGDLLPLFKEGDILEDRGNDCGFGTQIKITGVVEDGNSFYYLYGFIEEGDDYGIFDSRHTSIMQFESDWDRVNLD